MHTLCPICKVFFNTRRALNIHLSLNSRCERILNKKVFQAFSKKRRHVDLEAPEDNLEEDPPEGWEGPLDEQMQLDIDEASRHFYAPDVLHGSEQELGREKKRVRLENKTDRNLFCKEYPHPAGSSFGISETMYEKLQRTWGKGQTHHLGPFEDRDEWELAEWLFKSGASQTEMDKYLKLKITRTCTRPSFKNKKELLNKIDSLPRGARWMCHTFKVTGDLLDCNGEQQFEDIDIWTRDPVECIRELIGNPMFRDNMKYAPEKLYADEDLTEEVFNEMWTAEWWWKLQERLPEKATVVPVILASDKTQLTQFSGDKQAWPVYLSIGNIAKDVRKKTSSGAMILLGYLPVTKLDCFSSQKKQGVAYRIFHRCMTEVLKPLIAAGTSGVRMTCADRHIRHVYPILAAYIADFPEQCLIAAVKESQCPICQIKSEERGTPNHHPFRSSTDTLTALRAWEHGEEQEFVHLGLRPIPHPFWEKLPHCDIFTCFTPDLLHQLHKGVFKDHLVKWCTSVAGKEIIDARFKKLPNYPSLREFKKGISSISQWTGREYKEMEKVFASLISGAVPGAVTAVARAVIDFIYYASFESHSTETLRRLQDALNTFHEHKDVFVELSVREHFRIPKIHAMEHYISLIRLKGTADGFNTELSERLHIDCAKEGYRASNKKGYTKQMVRFLERHEAMHRFSSFLTWLEIIRKEEDNSDEDEDEDDEDSHMENTESILTYPGQAWSIASKPSWPSKSVTEVIREHTATDFIPALNAYLKKHVPGCVVPASNADYIDVYKRISAELPSLQRVTHKTTKDVIRATPAHKPRGRNVTEPAHFDCVLVHVNDTADDIGLDGYRVARIRVLFRLPSWFRCTDILAYVEWFTPFGPPHMPLRMSRISYSLKSNGRRQSAVINMAAIRCSCYLTPNFGDPTRKQQSDRTMRWDRQNVLDQCSKFFFNSQISLRMFQMADGDYVLDRN